MRIFATVALSVLAAATYNVVHGPRYTASMRLLVSPGEGAMPLQQPQNDARGATLLLPDHGQAARNLAALLNDPGLVASMLPPAPVAWRSNGPLVRGIGALGGPARRLAERVGLLAPQAGEDASTALVMRNFTAAALGDTDVLKLDLTWNDPHFAAAALSTIASGAAQAVSSAAEARAALTRARAGLDEAQGELDALEAAGPAVNAAERTTHEYGSAGSEEIARQRGVIEARLAVSNAAADQIRVALELARRGQAATDSAYRGGGWVGEGEGGKLAQKFADLLEKKQALAAASNAAAGGAIDAKIAQVREQNYRHVRARYADEIAAQAARLALSAAATAADDAALRASDAHIAQAQLVAQSRAAGTKQLGRARARVRQAQLRIDGAWQEVGAIRVLSQARAPDEADWPAPSFVLRIAAFAGLAAGLLHAALTERARRTIDYPDDIERRLGIEVLARLADQPAELAR